MKRIHFDHKVDWIMLAILLAAVGAYVLAYNWLGAEHNYTEIFATLGGILNVVALSKIFWYKYYVRWNANHILLRLNSFSGHSIRFKDIKHFEFSDSRLVINKIKSSKKIIIPTAKIAKEDLERLENILQDHTSSPAKNSPVFK